MYLQFAVDCFDRHQLLTTRNMVVGSGFDASPLDKLNGS